MTLQSHSATYGITLLALTSVNLTSNESERLSWDSSTAEQSVPLHRSNTLFFHHRCVPLPLYHSYHYAKCISNLRLRKVLKRFETMNCCLWNISDVVTNVSTWAVKILRKYGKPTKVHTIVLYGCRYMDLWSYTVHFT